LPSASTQQGGCGLLSKSISRQKFYEFLGRPTLLRKGLDSICRHHQILITPRHSIAVLGKGAGQKKTFIPQGAVNLVAEDGRTHVNQILAASSGTVSPLDPKHIVGERLDSRHPGKFNPAINDVILAH
jgi:hypothetical protein